MKQSILYLECNSGISGDMVVGALLDLGADRQLLEEALASLPLEGYKTKIGTVFKSGIKACDFDVKLSKGLENHDHDMAYLYGKDEPVNEQPKNHQHRNLRDISDIISAGKLTAGAADLALKIFTILAKAEAKVHGKDVNEVHFHEVGAVDSIVDIVAAAVCMDNLKPDAVVVSALTDGCGQIRCQHGIIPVPVPAVTAIAEAENLTLKLTETQGELVTPTGAAIAAAARTAEKLPEAVRICKVGLGAGKRDYPTAGVLRAMLLEDAGDEELTDSILELETNIDDCSGEALSFTLQQLMDAGALDSYFIPVDMKKGRPAYLLTVICNHEDREAMESIIFQNTTTIGIRRREMQRTRLARQTVSLSTPWGSARIKCCEYEGIKRFYPENDSVCTLAKEKGIGFGEMYGLLQSYARDQLSG